MAKKQLNVLQRLWIAATNPKAIKNTIGDNLLSLPLFNRPNTLDTTEFGDILLSDQDYYRGYLYSAIKKRGNRVAQMATENLKTKLQDDLDAKPHPYLEIIDRSPTFSNHFFWRALSTFIDLEGVAYLLALRNFNGRKFGDIQEFKLLNPYNLHRVVNSQGELGGYIEYQNGRQREIPVEMVIMVHDLNPFNLKEGYAMTDAAKDSQYLNQQSGAFTRQALKKNVGQRGLITTEVLMEDAEFENFKARVKASGGVQGAGDFLFGNGPGSIHYEDMQIDLDKLALEKIKEFSREELFAVAGVSKTIMGIEVSGVTRESGKVQSDLFDSNEIIPQLQTIIDALNQDYKNSYQETYETTPQIIYIDSPLKRDREAEKADAETLKVKSEAAQILISTGFNPDEVLEQVGLEEMTFEKPEPAVPPQLPPEEEPEEEQETITNAAGPIDKLQPLVKAKETSLANDVINIERQMIQAVMRKIEKNKLQTEALQVEISVAETKRIKKQLIDVMADFAQSLISLFGPHAMRKRIEQFGLTAVFRMNKDVNKFILDHSRLAADSHVDAVLEEIYKVAQQAASEGLGRSEIVSKLSTLFSDKIAKARATRIARTEANRVSSEAQYQADTQFIEQNDLGEQAFKKWTVRSDNPCAYCLQLASEPPIPFFQPFRKVGDSIDVEDEERQQSRAVDYEDIDAGTAHPNCSCVYEIVFIRN